jgi:hypothetical protein
VNLRVSLIGLITVEAPIEYRMAHEFPMLQLPQEAEA